MGQQSFGRKLLSDGFGGRGKHCLRFCVALVARLVGSMDDGALTFVVILSSVTLLAAGTVTVIGHGRERYHSPSESVNEPVMLDGGQLQPVC